MNIMNKIKISNVGFMVAILAFAGLFALGVQAATLVANISAPTASGSYVVGQSISLGGAATGGTGTYPSFKWTFSDGTASVIGANQSVTFATAGSKTITLTVTDSNGDKAVTAVSVNVASPSTKPVISNVRATNITQTSVTILWDTNIPATSRVIYDTTSRPDISGQTAPNFGYSFSTDTFNSDTKVTSHSVNITGLSPSTRYYFRVISG